MNNFEKSVPFDPGYSKISFSFMEGIAYATKDYAQLKTPHQKKFRLTQIESAVVDLINKSAAFYLGCILWGGFLHSRFKDSPKEITGNYAKKLSADALKDYDCAEETKLMLAYIESLDKDCKYYLKKPAKISPLIIGILKDYGEFAQLNNNFLNVEKTSNIKLPKSFAHFEKLSNEQLDILNDKIAKIIESGKIENLLEIGYYK